MSTSIVLITGGSNGIGLETCLQFAQQPDIHVLLASRSVEKGEKAVAQIKQQGIKGSLSLVQLDVTDDNSIAAAVKQVEADHGRLDTLINNAGICPTDVTRELFRETFETNCISPSMVTKAFAPLLDKSKTPRVIHVSSTLGSMGLRMDPSNGAYGADFEVYRITKAALNMLRACQAWEYKSKGFKVFSYCPGFVVSDLSGWRQKKIDMNTPGPEKSAEGLLAIHRGAQDDHVEEFVNDSSVLKGTAPNPW